MNVFGGLAIQQIANQLLDTDPVAGPLIKSKELRLNVQSLNNATNNKGNKVKPDFQLLLGGGNTAVLDITTKGSKDKIWKYEPKPPNGNPASVPFLINILYR